MKYPKILIHYITDLDVPPGHWSLPSPKYMFSASIVILTDGNTFRCIKNLYGSVIESARIPVSLMTAFIMEYEEFFTKQELVESLVYEMSS